MQESELHKKFEYLDFVVDKSMRYHQRRRAFYDGFHKVLMMGVILSSSSAVAWFDVSEIPWLALCATLIAAFDLVASPSHKSRDHQMLYGRFSELAIKIRARPISEDLYYDCVAERIRIESKEYPVYYALDVDCHNEVCQALGADDKMRKITWWQRFTRNLCCHAGEEFPERKPANNKEKEK